MKNTETATIREPVLPEKTHARSASMVYGELTGSYYSIREVFKDGKQYELFVTNDSFTALVEANKRFEATHALQVGISRLVIFRVDWEVKGLDTNITLTELPFDSL